MSSAYCCIGLWGPRARDLLSRVCEDDVSDAAFPYLTGKRIAIGEVPALALRISYVGELGWEIYAPTEMGLRLWDIMWDAGAAAWRNRGGAAARSTRCASKRATGFGATTFTPITTPMRQAPDSPSVCERDASSAGTRCARVRAEGVSRRLCCMTLNDPNAVVVGNEPIVAGDDVLGYVTSANYGHSVGRGIVYGYLPVEYAGVGTEVDVIYFGERLPATVAKEPLYDPSGGKMRGKFLTQRH